MGDDKADDKQKEKELSKDFTRDMATDNDIEKQELTKFGEFCQRHGINANLIMLKITLFVMYGGTLSAWKILFLKKRHHCQMKIFRQKMVTKGKE